MNLIYGKGYDKQWEVLKLATDLGLIEKSGAWYKHDDSNFAQGELNAVAYLKENEEFYATIRKDVLDMVGLTEIYERNSQ